MVITSLLSISTATAAFAGTWEQNNQGKWWYQEDDNSYPASTWEWIDANSDGLSECYYFDQNGYLLTNTMTPDGYTVNESGAWVNQGIIQQKPSTPNTVNEMEKNGIQLLQTANQKLTQLDSVDAKGKLQCQLSTQGIVIPVNADFLMQYHNLHNENMQFLLSANLNMLNENYNFSAFYTNNYFYINMDDNKEKHKVEYSEIAEALNDVTLNNTNWDLFKNVQVQTDENGNRILTCSVDKDKLYSAITSLDGYSTEIKTAFDNLSINQFDCKYVINPEGYFIKNTVSMNVAYTEDGNTASIVLTMDVDYNNPGQPVSVQIPSTDGYTLQ
jgi:hypothetical protein